MSVPATFGPTYLRQVAASLAGPVNEDFIRLLASGLMLAASEWDADRSMRRSSDEAFSLVCKQLESKFCDDNRDAIEVRP